MDGSQLYPAGAFKIINVSNRHLIFGDGVGGSAE
jgi:hypothetical protein